MQLSPEQWKAALAFANRHAGAGLAVHADAVCIGAAPDLAPPQHSQLQTILKSMRPYRKGPFEIFGQRIDANWKSDRKWDRLQKYLPALADLQDARICDIGCNNGYYMFRLHALAAAHAGPSGLREVVGLDPVVLNQQCFQFLQTLAAAPDLHFIAAGYDWLEDQRERFDLILCMGILYHHTDPVRILRLIQGALKKGGQLIVESLGLPAPADVPQDQAGSPNCLVPAGRYAGMRGVWNVPDASALGNWMRRSGLQRVEILEEHDYTTDQVRTSWGDLPGLQEVLDPVDPTRTIEGYPAPVRIWARAYR